MNYRDEIYNYEIKEKFIEERKDSTRKNILSFFANIASYERSNGVDLLNMTREQTLCALSSLGYYKYSNIRQAKSWFSKYLDWGIKKGLTTKNQLDFIKPRYVDISENMKRSIIKSDEKLSDIINRLYTDNYGVSARAVTCLLWIGLSIDNCRSLLSSDVDLKRKVIANNNYEYPIPDCFIDILDSYMRAQSVVVDENKRSYERPLLEGKYFIKKIMIKNMDAASKLSYGALGKHITRFAVDFKNEYGDMYNISSDSIIDSGMYYRIYIEDEANKLLTRDVILRQEYIQGMDLDKASAALLEDRYIEYQVYKKIMWKK